MSGISLSDWDDVGALVEQALKLPAGEREALLREACAGDAARLKRARRVLQAATDAESFLDGSAADLAPHVVGAASARDDTGDEEPAAPSTIGPYRVLRPLGRGGMGDVYLADRADDEFERRVAIKVVRRGLGDDLIARFRHERQVLASLDHPHIARLYDGGVTDDGRPYLVMEHVDGQPIDAFADRAGLNVDERLALFLQVCEAVDRAHRRFVVHRDLKPANVLVTPGGSAKLLDFGVAKLLDPGTAGHGAPLTRADMRVMTPEYAAPEQFLGEPTTTATDLYALGVLLYELLTGRRPCGAADGSSQDLERQVLEGTIGPPSDAARSGPEAETRARSRGTTVDGLARTLRGDLDNIVLTALRREPERRYGSVAELKADILRYQSGLPVAARPATVRYRTGKFIRRHRFGVAAALLLFAATAIGATTTLVQARAAAREGLRAERIRAFLVDVFELSGPNESGAEDVTARALLDRGRERVRVELAETPAVRAEMLGVLGTLYHQLGLFDDARGLFEDALAERRAQAAPPADLIDSLTDLASALYELDDLDGAETLIQEALSLAIAEEGLNGTAVASVNSELASIERARGDFAEAEALHRSALAVRRANGDPSAVANSLNGLGVVLYESGHPDDAIVALEESARLKRQVYGDRHTDVALTECNLATAIHRAGQMDAAIAAFHQCVDHRRALLGDDHPNLAFAINNLAQVHAELNEYDTAEALHGEALRIRRAAFGEHHTAVAGSLNNLAVVAFRRGDYAGAAERFRELVEVWTELVGQDHPNTLTVTNNLGMALRSAGALAEAETVLTEVLAARERTLGADHPDAAASLVNLATVVRRLDRYAEARALVSSALPVLAAAYPDGHPLVGIARVELGRAELGAGAPDAALAAFDEAIVLRTSIFGADHLQTAEARIERGRALDALGRSSDARAEIEAAMADLAAAGHDESATATLGRNALAALGGRDRN